MDGILVINKPAGMTSHDVISRLRKQYQQKKFGHTGTLDPQASGVLVVLAGKAAKCLQFLSDTDKEYISRLELGSDTDTDDAWGEVIDTKPVDRNFDFGEQLEKLVGEQHLQVPAASAKKVNGKKLLDYKRAGQPVPEVFQDITVYDAKVIDDEELRFSVSCSSGTYVRSLCRKLAHDTGNCGHMAELVRTRAGVFTLDDADELDGPHRLHSIDEALQGWKRVYWPETSDIYNGKRIQLDSDADRVLIVDEHDTALAVYEREQGSTYRSARGLW